MFLLLLLLFPTQEVYASQYKPGALGSHSCPRHHLKIVSIIKKTASIQCFKRSSIRIDTKPEIELQYHDGYLRTVKTANSAQRFSYQFRSYAKVGFITPYQKRQKDFRKALKYEGYLAVHYNDQNLVDKIHNKNTSRLQKVHYSDSGALKSVIVKSAADRSTLYTCHYHSDQVFNTEKTKMEKCDEIKSAIRKLNQEAPIYKNDNSFTYIKTKPRHLFSLISRNKFCYLVDTDTKGKQYKKRAPDHKCEQTNIIGIDNAKKEVFNEPPKAKSPIKKSKPTRVIQDSMLTQ